MERGIQDQTQRPRRPTSETINLEEAYRTKQLADEITATIYKNDCDHLKEILKKVSSSPDLFSVLKQQKNGQTILHNAVWEGDSEALTCLLQPLADQRRKDLLSIQDNNGYTVFHIAVSKYKSDVLVSLLENLDKEKRLQILSLQDNDGWNVLHMSALLSRLEAVEFICESLPQSDRVQLITSQAKHRITAFHCAAQTKNGCAIFIYLANHLNLHTKYLHECIASRCRPPKNWSHLPSGTCLHIAIEKGNADLVDYILKLSLASSRLGVMLTLKNANRETVFDLDTSNNPLVRGLLRSCSTEEQLLADGEIEGLDLPYTTALTAPTNQPPLTTSSHLSSLDDPFTSTTSTPSSQLRGKRITFSPFNSTKEFDSAEVLSLISSSPGKDEVTTKLIANKLEAVSLQTDSDVIDGVGKSGDSGTDCSTSDDSDGEPWLSDYSTLNMRSTRRRRIRAKMKTKRIYQMSQPVRGRALILNMECFDTPLNEGQECLNDRDGSDVDCRHITKLLTDLGFQVRIREDLSSQRALDEIRDETQHPDHEKYGMFVLVILSHGSEDVFYGSDGRPVYQKDLFKILSPVKFPAMTGKPKWIIMQCCAGDGVDKIQKIKKDSSLSGSVNVSRKIDRNYSSFTDLIIFKASFPGFTSARHPRYGSCFIKLLVELFYKHACHSDIVTLARKLRRRVLKETEQVEQADIGSQTVTTIETLHNELYLFPSYNPDLY